MKKPRTGCRILILKCTLCHVMLLKKEDVDRWLVMTVIMDDRSLCLFPVQSLVEKWWVLWASVLLVVDKLFYSLIGDSFGFLYGGVIKPGILCSCSVASDYLNEDPGIPQCCRINKIVHSITLGKKQNRSLFCFSCFFAVYP